MALPRVAASWMVPLLAAAPVAGAAQQGAGQPSMAERLADDPRVEALRPYGMPIPPSPHADNGVQFGKALRFRLAGHNDFWRIGVTTPTLKPVRAGDRIVIAFWARATDTEGGKPGRIGRVQLEATPVVRAIFEKSFDVGPDWTMYQLQGVADRDYGPSQLNAALHIDAARQTLELGPVFVFDYGKAAG